MTFSLDSRLCDGSHLLSRLPLCEARLQDDSRFAWIVLIPRRSGLIELADLAFADRLQLLEETLVAGDAVRAVAAAADRPVSKLNHGQLGNRVAQLHVHIVGRRPDDPAWPDPVWGCGVAEAYAPAALQIACVAALAVFDRLSEG